MTPRKAFLILFTTAMLLAACARVDGSAPSAGQTSSQEQIGPPSSAAEATGEPTPDVTSDRLAAPFTYDEGLTRLDPADGSFSPQISSSEAYQIFLKSGVYPNAPRVSTPQLFLANYTTYVQGNGSATGGSVSYDQLPVWVIRFTDVPDEASGAGGAAGSETSVGSSVELHDILAIVDATDGTPVAVLSDLPDATAQPEPPATAPGFSPGKSDASA
jgi:hypothetical protein